MMSERSLIRSAHHSDFESAYEIECQSFLLPWDDELFVLLTRRNGRVPVSRSRQLFMDVLELDKEVIGYIIWEEEYIQGRGHILNLAVSANHRRRGYGRQLLLHGFASMKAAGLKECELEVRVNNSSARSLYESFGMKLISIEQAYYEDEDAAVYMISLSRFNS